MKRIRLIVTLFVLPLVGCSTWVNDTAKAKEPGYIYAVGARQKFFGTKSTVWLCPTDVSSSDRCKRVNVNVRLGPADKR